MRAPVLALLLLSACSPPPFTPAATCEAEGFGAILLEDPTQDCACVVRKLRAAAQLLEAEGVADPGQDWTPVAWWIRSHDESWERNGRWLLGLYHPIGDGRGDVEVERLQRSTAHEMMHHLDLQRGASEWETARHEGWEARGWTALGRRFRAQAEPWGVLRCSDYGGRTAAR